MTTITVTGTQFLAHSGQTFRSATEAQRSTGVSRKTAALLRSQPGYRAGQVMTVRFSSSGAPRLYARVGREWMDASLQDITE